MLRPSPDHVRALEAGSQLPLSIMLTGVRYIADDVIMKHEPCMARDTVVALRQRLN